LLINFLLKKGYPCVRVFNSKGNKPYVKYKGIEFAIFELVNPGQKFSISANEAYEMGKYLGKLHVLAKKFPIRNIYGSYEHVYNLFRKKYYKKKRGKYLGKINVLAKIPIHNIYGIYGGYEHINNLFMINYSKKKNAPKRMQKNFEYIKNNIRNLKVPSSLPKSICHREFIPPHVMFENQKLIRVIDWDRINRDYMFYDLGITMTSAIQRGKLNFNLLARIIEGYDEERKLTAWERNHLFEAIQFGAFKFAIWALEDIDNWGWDAFNRHVKMLMKYDKTEFSEKLAKFIELE